MKISGVFKRCMVFPLLALVPAVHASVQGDRIYQYDAGCALFEVYEQVPEVINGLATGAAQHTLIVTNHQQDAILDGVAVSPEGAVNITPSSRGQAFAQGFIELARIPNGIQLVVMAQNPSQPFSWRFNAKCRQGAVGVLHFDEVRSTPPRNDLSDKEIDKIFFGDAVHLENGPTKDDYSRPITINPPRNDIDNLLAGLERPASAPLTEAYQNVDPFADALLKADKERIRNKQLQTLAQSTDAATNAQYQASTNAQKVAALHLEEFLEAKRREAERLAEERERARQKQEGIGQFIKGASSIYLGAAGVYAGMDAGQAAKLGVDFYNSTNSGDPSASLAQVQKNINDGVYYQPSQRPAGSHSPISAERHQGAAAGLNNGDIRASSSYSQASQPSTSKDSRCAVNGYVGNERSVYWNGASLSCGDGSAPRISGYAYWAGMFCGGDTTGPTDARQCSPGEYQSAERSAASKLPADMARQYGLDQ